MATATAIVDTPLVLGLDIGGATLKAADSHGRVVSLPFALYREPQRLAEKLRRLLAPWFATATDSVILPYLPSLSEQSKFANLTRSTVAVPVELAVTMTGELCDCFATKADGVCQIVTAVVAAAPTSLPIRIWTTTGKWINPDTALAQPWLAAAANWLAQAEWLRQEFPAPFALLIDIGSTTTDILVYTADRTLVMGRTDTERLANGTLVYSGVVRTPICAKLQQFVAPPPYAATLAAPEFSEPGNAPGEAVPEGMPYLTAGTYRLMAEWFATALDAYLILQQLPEANESQTLRQYQGTADGRPATRTAAKARLARLIGADDSVFPDHWARELALQFRQAQCQEIANAIKQVIRQAQSSLGTKQLPSRILLSGQGDWLAEDMLAQIPALAPIPQQRLSQHLSVPLSACAGAYAVARLAAADLVATAC